VGKVRNGDDLWGLLRMAAGSIPFHPMRRPPGSAIRFSTWPAPRAVWIHKDEAKNLALVRAFYRDLFAESGGVPMPGEAYDGALINHSDIDLADPTLNTSGVPWHQLYYKTNYPRLQRIKARWDPRDVFQHALSIRMR